MSNSTLHGAPASASDAVVILYTNYRGETAVRRIVPGLSEGRRVVLQQPFWFGESDWHKGADGKPEPQWFLRATDADPANRDHRDFALSGVLAWGQEAVDAALAPVGVPESVRLGVEPGETAFRAFYEHGGASWVDLSLLGRQQWARVEVALARRARSIHAPSGAVSEQSVAGAAASASDAAKTPGQAAAERVCHDEQMQIWSNEVAGCLSMGNYLRDDLSYDDGISLCLDLQREIRRVVESAFDHPELAALAPPAVPESVRRLSEAATQGKWRRGRSAGGEARLSAPGAGNKRVPEANVNWAGFAQFITEVDGRPHPTGEANADFAVAAVNYVRTLLSPTPSPDGPEVSAPPGGGGGVDESGTYRPKIETCGKCGAQGAAFICDQPGCPVNGGAAHPGQRDAAPATPEPAKSDGFTVIPEAVLSSEDAHALIVGDAVVVSATPEPAAGGGREAWMQTYRLPHFRVLDPQPTDVLIEDIAHHLAQAVRYGGAGIRWLSVAEHSVHMARAAAPEHKLWALLHDAPEAYLHDVVRPVKRTLVGYKEAEDRLMRAICQRFGLPLEMPREVKRLDNRICIDERAQNMAPSDVVWTYGGETEPLGITLEYWTPERAEREFLTLFAELTGKPVAMPRSILSAPAGAQTAGGEGWLPIETAPKSDEDILVAASWFDDNDVEHRYTTISSYEDQPDRRGFRHRNGAQNATHWRPLPAPPSSTATAHDAPEGGQA